MLKNPNIIILDDRPAGKISQEAQRYAAAITVHSNGIEADAKSILAQEL